MIIFSVVHYQVSLYSFEKVLKSGRILLSLNTSELRFNHFIVYMYNFNTCTKNSFLAKYILLLWGSKKYYWVSHSNWGLWRWSSWRKITLHYLCSWWSHCTEIFLRSPEEMQPPTYFLLSWRVPNGR